MRAISLCSCAFYLVELKYLLLFAWIVIRSGVEISTAQIGVAPKGTIVSITGRSFSDHPKSCCIERLRLAGGRGWISARLNQALPGDGRIVELIGLDDR